MFSLYVGRWMLYSTNGNQFGISSYLQISDFEIKDHNNNNVYVSEVGHFGNWDSPYNSNFDEELRNY